MWEHFCWEAFALLYTALGWVQWRRKSGGTNPAHAMRPAVEVEAGEFDSPVGVRSGDLRPTEGFGQETFTQQCPSP